MYNLNLGARKIKGLKNLSNFLIYIPLLIANETI